MIELRCKPFTSTANGRQSPDAHESGVCMLRGVSWESVRKRRSCFDRLTALQFTGANSDGDDRKLLEDQ